jgi:TetR/AcrR family tetracycline transcriptional repressor
MATGAPVPGRRGALSRKAIVSEALALVDEQGLEALSMRRLAERLGVAPMSLYRHVRNKAELTDALVDHVYVGLRVELDDECPWDERVLRLSRIVRSQLRAHPAIVPLALQQLGSGPHGLRLGEAIYAALGPAALPDEAVVGATYALLVYILGFVALEMPRPGTDTASTEDVVRRMQSFFGSLPAAEFPHHVRFAPELARFTSDERFEFGVRTFLAGLRGRSQVD